MAFTLAKVAPEASENLLGIGNSKACGFSVGTGLLGVPTGTRPGNVSPLRGGS